MRAVISRTRAKRAQRVGMIRKIRNLLPNHVLKRIYAAQVRSIMARNTGLQFGAEIDNISGLQKLQDRFCRENQVKLPPVEARLNYLTLLLLIINILQTQEQTLASVSTTLTASSLRYFVTVSKSSRFPEQRGRPVH